MKQEKFGKTLKNIRKKQKMTQKMLAHGICSQSVLSRIENGTDIPNVLVMKNLCLRLNVTIDQVLHLDSDEIFRVQRIFRRVHHHLIHQRYQDMENILQESAVVSKLFLDTDFQQYYYYLGSCEFFLHHSLDAAINSLKKGLSYTYKSDKENVSPQEILIMSCLGRIFGDANQIEDAQLYLQTSYELLHRLSENFANFELTKLFYNYASFLLEQSEDERARLICLEGISWARERSSYYYLRELFLLCSQIYTDRGQMSAAQQYRFLSDQVLNIRQNGVDLS